MKNVIRLLDVERQARRLHKRFWSKVNVGQPWECWNWKWEAESNPYGTFFLNGKNERANRISYRLQYGDIPDGMIVLHSCDNPNCVNPNHLSIGTHKENSEDCSKKGRQCKGEDVSTSKLTPEEVEKIFYSTGPIREAGEQYGVSQCVISRIRNRKAWRHVTNALT